MWTPKFFVMMVVALMGLIPVGVAGKNLSSIREEAQVLVNQWVGRGIDYAALDQKVQKDMEKSCGPLIQDVAKADQIGPIVNKVMVVMPYTKRVINVSWVFFGPCENTLVSSSVGGRLFFSSSWLAKASEADLWATIAHELSHVRLRHSLVKAALWHLKVSGDKASKIEEEMELEADLAATDLLREAGKDPRMVVAMLNKLASTYHSLSAEEGRIITRRQMVEKSLATQVASIK